MLLKIRGMNKEETGMKTDIQIAQEAEMKHIREVAEGAGIAEAELVKGYH